MWPLRKNELPNIYAESAVLFWSKGPKMPLQIPLMEHLLIKESGRPHDASESHQWELCIHMKVELFYGELRPEFG